MRSYTVKQNPISTEFREILWYRQTHTHILLIKDISYLLYYKDNIQDINNGMGNYLVKVYNTIPENEINNNFKVIIVIYFHSKIAGNPIQLLK